MTQDLLTEAERRQWASLGYLHLRKALSNDDVVRTREALAAVEHDFAGGDHNGWADVFDAGNDRDLSITNGLKWCPELDRLVDHPNVFGKIVGLLGPYLQLLGSEIFFRYPSAEPLVAFHTDQGPSLRNGAAGPSVQLKAQFFLTDVATDNSGNFAVVPGSHLQTFPGKIDYRDVDQPVQIRAHAGDVVVFPLALGHGVAPNDTETTRISVVLRFGQLFCRPVDYWTTPEPAILARQTPRRRRLLGDFGARTRPGDVYGVIPDQLDLIYGEEWADSTQATKDFAEASRALDAYQVF
ncbi:phytanoyl-CoA dioxygenase family protein [Nocardia salmonicida]|uniref:phytanoyl-CoA dioxygenase family protein n=1 Tax=Nocardia salmonicida TaxID=53431 RepID=UPI0036C93BC6